MIAGVLHKLARCGAGFILTDAAVLRHFPARHERNLPEVDYWRRVGQGTDHVVADGSGSLAEMSPALLLVANKAIVPCKASIE